MVSCRYCRNRNFFNYLDNDMTPDNPITDRGGGIEDTATIIEVFQIEFIILLSILSGNRKRRSTKEIAK